MSNKPHMRISDKRGPKDGTGLIEAYVSEDRKVVLQMFPPGRDAVVVGMAPDEARGLAQGLLEGAEEAERGTDT